MTSLIDVIFLLLLFFMLSSTFSKYAELPLPIGAAGGTVTDVPAVFLRVSQDAITLNGNVVAIEDLGLRLAADQNTPVTAIIGLGPDVTSQRLTDVLAMLQSTANLSLNVLVPT